MCRYVLDCLLIPANRIILYGRSLGSGPSVELASRRLVAGMILQSPIASVHRVRFSPPFTLPGDMYANVDKISKTGCCILFIHGTMDDIVPFEHSKAMFELCNSQKAFGCWIAGAGHNNIESHFSSALNWHVKRFLKLLQPPGLECRRRALTGLSTASSLGDWCVGQPRVRCLRGANEGEQNCRQKEAITKGNGGAAQRRSNRFETGLVKSDATTARH
eukprot:GHVS01071644.1.p1 GENE.GHVS01071644.1~~GHVS01071644.1.p1  ORF type:complete len:218 (+),score=22.94 GHVS01071644.1:275-928(+)